MKQYYIYLDGQQVGPLTPEELQQYKITTETMIWFEGLADWQKANTIEDLKPLFKAVPPPIHKVVATPPPQIIPTAQVRETHSSIIQPDSFNTSKVFGIRRKVLLYFILGILLITGISAFKNHIENNDRLSYESEMRIAEQERIAREQKIKELTSQIVVAKQNLDIAKQQLHDASAFKLLRGSNKRHKDISDAEEVVSSWQNHLNDLENQLRSIHQ